MPLSPGKPLPRLVANHLDGAAADVATPGRPVLLFVYRTDCPACPVGARVLPRFGQLHGLDLVALSQDGAGPSAGFAGEAGWTGRIRHLLDGAPWPASSALKVRVTPTWILADADGRVVTSAEGWSRADANALAGQAAGLLGVPPPVVSPEDGPEPAWRPG
jgi:hypothetical protein